MIYIIPYTSIIEQTHQVFNEIFGEENIIAHYAEVDYKDDEDGSYTNKRRLATENWDAPLILTTSVQFFESLYANRSSRCRKLHNIAKSVLIFDEAQMLPVPYLKPCLSALGQLVGKYGCSAVLCTATQPALNPLLEEYLPQKPVLEICPPALAKDKIFRRISFVYEGLLENEELAEKLRKEKQVLCIVTSRKQAQEIYGLLKGNGVYHLSTTMYHAHRRRIFAEIDQRLKNGRVCKVISTSLIEAGVDLDFPAVYRALAGLDSMLQAGGRCNREGKRPAEESLVHLFKSADKAPGIIRKNMAAAEGTMRNYEDILSPEAIQAYFNLLYYTLKDAAALDAKGILQEIEAALMPFASIAERFKLIEGPDCLIYIPLEEGEALGEELKYTGLSRRLMRKLGQYAVGVFPQHFKALLDAGATERISENAAILRDLKLYDEHTGLAFQPGEGLAHIV